MNETFIRKMDFKDLKSVVRIHQKAFQDFFLTQLGYKFLYQYYKLIIRDKDSIAYVSCSNNNISGFVCGSNNPEGFYKLFLLSSHLFFFPLIVALFKNPMLIFRIFSSLIKVFNNSNQESFPEGCAELSSIAVVKKGGGTANNLLSAFSVEVRRKGTRYIYLNTNKERNERVHNFYKKNKFEQIGIIRKNGREVSEYLLDLKEE